MKLYNLLTNGYKYNNFYELLFSNYLSNDTPEIYEYTGVVPYTFTANGAALLDWYIKGNTGGVGDKTANLFDKSSNIVAYYLTQTTGIYSATLSTSRSALIPCEPSTTYTIHVPTNRTLRIVEFEHYPQAGDVGSNYTSQETGTYIDKDVTITTTATAEYLCVFCYNSAQEATEYTESAYFSQVMINTGSTALPYEPYGYKIPVLCGDETTNIYIDAPLDASDMIAMSDTGISIPTVQGSNTISVDTTVQPSEVYIKYIGG